VSEAVLGSEDSPAKAEAPASVARSSTWETDSDELQRQCRQDRRHRRDGLRARVACRYQLREVQGHEVGDGEQQPSELGLDLARECVKVQHASPR
jgi:hypothetical protein